VGEVEAGEKSESLALQSGAASLEWEPQQHGKRFPQVKGFSTALVSCLSLDGELLEEYKATVDGRVGVSSRLLLP
jgi:hypothetical protein